MDLAAVLLTCFLALLSLWRPVFRQERSYRRALRQALGSLTVLGTATLTRILASLGLDQQEGSAEYRLQARSEWDEQALFDTLLPNFSLEFAISRGCRRGRGCSE